jgi:mono/diheme cytochrome c family protein
MIIKAKGWLLAGSATCVCLLNSCQISLNCAFPTAQAVASAGRGSDISTLERGRKIYTTSCTECHVARPIAQRTVEQWIHMVGIMAPRARLNPADRAALQTYLIAAREYLPQS